MIGVILRRSRWCQTDRSAGIFTHNHLLTESGVEKRKHPALWEENASLMPEVRGELSDWMELKGKQELK